MGRPAGLSLVRDKKIIPELVPGSKNYKLLILNTTLQLILSTKVVGNKQRQEWISRIENEMYELENGAMFSGT
jgi:hypothetical protein